MSVEQLFSDAERARRTGETARAREAYEQLSVHARSEFLPDVEARALLALGELAIAEDDAKGARALLTDAVARAMEGGVPLVEAGAYLALAHASFDLGRSKDGHDALLEAMALYRSLDGRPAMEGLARSMRLYGEHLGVLGDAKEARNALEIARVMFADLGDAEGAAGVVADMARLEEFAR